jgi:hypothetical protein
MADVEYQRRGHAYIVLHRPTAVCVYLPREAVLLEMMPDLLRGRVSVRQRSEAQAVARVVTETLQRYARGELPRID